MPTARRIWQRFSSKARPLRVEGTGTSAANTDRANELAMLESYARFQGRVATKDSLAPPPPKSAYLAAIHGGKSAPAQLSKTGEPSTSWANSKPGLPPLKDVSVAVSLSAPFW